eukprot:Ihof_evm1s679 gene=Ihof_evmTU1s679
MADFDQYKAARLESQRGEAVAFSEQINNLLRHNEAIKAIGYVPLSLTDPTQIFNNAQDGRLLAHLINAIKPDTIPNKLIKMGVDKANLNKPGFNDAWEIANNNNLVIDAAIQLGCKVVNIGHQDLLNGNPDLILGLAWQLLRIFLMRDINLAGHPELIRLLKPNETIDKLMAINAEEMIMRWFNYHLQQGGFDEPVKNFGKDMSDCRKWVILLKQVAPRLSEEAGIDELMAIEDPLEESEVVDVEAEERKKKDIEERKKERDILKDEVTDWEREMQKVDVESIEQGAVIEKGSREQTTALKRARETLDHRTNEIARKTNEIERLKCEHESVSAEGDHLIETQHTKILELQSELSSLPETMAALQEQLAEKGQNVTEISDKMREAERLRAEKGRMMLEHVKGSNLLLKTRGNRLSISNLSVVDEVVDEAEAIKDVLDRQSKTFAQCLEDIKTTTSDFEESRENSKTQITEIAKAMEIVLGEGHATAEYDVSKIRKLIEILMARCDMQETQIKTLEVTLKKKKEQN